MATKTVEERARENFIALGRNKYPGRIIIVGVDERGQLVLLYAISGRSESSRNRLFVHDEKQRRLFTAAVDSSKIKNPELTLYTAMREESNREGTIYVVSNGSQTDGVVDDYREGKCFRNSMMCYSYEPDEPHFTPRITAICSWHQEKPLAMLSIVRRVPDSKVCKRDFYEVGGDNCGAYNIIPGIGYCMTTYADYDADDKKPLPSFQGEPYLVPLRGSIQMIADTNWKNLNPEYRIALAVKLVPKQGSSSMTIINRFKK